MTSTRHKDESRTAAASGSDDGYLDAAVVKVDAMADGSPLDPAKDFRVVCNNFMAGGGDNYFTLSKGRDKRDEGALVRDALERHVRMLSENGGAVDVKPDGRIQRIRR